MATSTSVLKTFAQQTRAKLVSLVSTKLKFLLNADTAEIRGYEVQIRKLRSEIASKGEKNVVEEVAYTWFNRVMALRYMDANGYNSPKVVTPSEGQHRPEILQDAMAGNIDEALRLSSNDVQLPEEKLYRKLLIAVCNNVMSVPMPFLFEHLTDYTELLLPDDLLSDQSFVTDIRNGMTDEDCQNVEIMGWLYQFYITDRKAEAEIKKSKKGGLKSDEQAAATQLFTPHWIVRYMVENSLGRIWMTLHPKSPLINEMPYYIATPEGQRDTIPEDIHSAKDIRFIDPCMGSGHILVYAFELFCKMYEEEGQLSKDIPALILQNNIYGIDIDHRCYQLASFALTMKAREYYSRYLRHTVNPNVIALEKIEHDTIDSTGAWGKKSLMWQFEHIDTIGSLLKVTPEECASIHIESGLFGERQQLMKTQAEYLSRKYHCVVTNPPYLGKGFGDKLKDYVGSQFPNSKSDLYAAFIERLSSLPVVNGYTAMVTMESWMFIPTYKALRRYIISNYLFKSLSHFDWQIMRIAFGTVSFVLQNIKPGENIKSVYSYLNRTDIDRKKEVPYTFPNKENGRYSIKKQLNFLKIPGTPIAYWVSENFINNFQNCLIDDISQVITGMTIGGNDAYLRYWAELSIDKLSVNKKRMSDINLQHSYWIPYSKGGERRKYYGNFDFAVNWSQKGNFNRAKTTLSHLYLREAITWPFVTSGKFSARFLPEGSLWDVAGSPCFFENKEKMFYTLGFLCSDVANYILSVTNPTINVQAVDIRNLPFILCHEKEISLCTQKNISISKKDWDAHETSWDFERNPLYEQVLLFMENSIQNVVPPSTSLESLLQYNVPKDRCPLFACMKDYKDKWEMNFNHLRNNEKELNRQFIEIYGLQDELTPDVPLDEITILQKGEISIEDNHIVWHDDVIIKQFISWLVGCFMGRYSVDKPGLIIASQGQKIEDLDLPAQTLEIDDDGIIPVIQESDFFADDMTQRIEAAIKTIFGELNFYDNMKFIKQCLGQELRDYLYKDYYNDHQQMYSVKMNGSLVKRPIYWMFSSKMGDKKKKGYFKALVYMHRMESDTLSKLHADYVHPYIQKIEHQLIDAEDNANRDDLSQAQRNKALKLVEEMHAKIKEVKEFETELVEMASARLTIDLDDGVKTNYPKFYPLVETIKGLEEAEA